MPRKSKPTTKAAMSPASRMLSVPSKPPTTISLSPIVAMSAVTSIGKISPSAVVTLDRSADLAGSCSNIREAWYHRQMLVRSHGALVRQLKALCRRAEGGDKIKGTALFKKLLKGKASPEVLGASMILMQAHNLIEVQRKAQEDHLYMLVRQLPAIDWIESIRGVSENALASVIGEAGDLNNYDSPAKLWKRLGLGLVEHKGEHIRQRKAKDKKLAELMGYSPNRRAVMFIIGGNIIKARKGATGIAAELLDYYEAEKAKAVAKGLTKGHAHKRAQRHMEKLFLKLLWRKWTGRGKEWSDVEAVTEVSSSPVLPLRRAA